MSLQEKLHGIIKKNKVLFLSTFTTFLTLIKLI
jgi:hypothetical protein